MSHLNVDTVSQHIYQSRGEFWTLLHVKFTSPVCLPPLSECFQLKCTVTDTMIERKCVGVTQVRQCRWQEWTGDVFDWDLSSDIECERKLEKSDGIGQCLASERWIQGE